MDYLQLQVIIKAVEGVLRRSVEVELEDVVELRVSIAIPEYNYSFIPVDFVSVTLIEKCGAYKICILGNELDVWSVFDLTFFNFFLH